MNVEKSVDMSAAYDRDDDYIVDLDSDVDIDNR